jgi:hypothetical protein
MTYCKNFCKCHHKPPPSIIIIIIIIIKGFDRKAKTNKKQLKGRKTCFGSWFQGVGLWLAGSIGVGLR